jgi:hypothetical protein
MDGQGAHQLQVIVVRSIVLGRARDGLPRRPLQSVIRLGEASQQRLLV